MAVWDLQVGGKCKHCFRSVLRGKVRREGGREGREGIDALARVRESTIIAYLIFFFSSRLLDTSERRQCRSSLDCPAAYPGESALAFPPWRPGFAGRGRVSDAREGRREGGRRAIATSVPLPTYVSLTSNPYIHPQTNKNRHSEALRELSLWSAAANEPSVRAVMGRITNNPASSYLITGRQGRREGTGLVACEICFGLRISC